MKSKKRRNKKNRIHLSVGIWIFIVVTVVVFLYCITSNLIIHFKDVPSIVQTIFGLSDLANTAIGALLGFGASLFLENYLVGKNKEKAIDNIVAEMIDMSIYINDMLSPTIIKNSQEIGINEAAKEVLDKYDQKEEYVETDDNGLSFFKARILNHQYKIYLPIWESILQNGDLLKFKEKAYFNILIQIYTRLNKFKVVVDSFDKNIAGKDLYNFIYELYKDVKSYRGILADDKNKREVLLMCDSIRDKEKLAEFKKKIIGE